LRIIFMSAFLYSLAFAQGPAALAELEKLLALVGVKVNSTSTRRPSERAPANAGSQELLVRMSLGPAPNDSRQPQNRLEVVSRKRHASTVPRLRSLDLHPDHWLYVAIDRQATLLSWGTVPDPRVLRAEEPGPDGVLTGRRVVRTEADVLLSVPDDPAVIAVRIFQPERRGDSFVLVPLGEVPLDSGR
jgi:hypothetical protein